MTITSLGESLLANILCAAIISAASQIRIKWVKSRKKLDPRSVKASFLWILGPWILSNVINVLWISYKSPPIANGNSLINTISIVSVPLISSVLCFWIIWRQLDEFWRVGIYGADVQVQQGIDYERALSICKESLSFMGTGARKLTEQSNFHATLSNCRRDKPIRFLLSKPTDPMLREAARNARKPEYEYVNNVTDSLQILSRLKLQQGLNIEVRFYPESSAYLPIFRLMIIDDAVCLLSYNYFGEVGEGRQLPQLHIARPSAAAGSVKYTFFYPLEGYFEWLWKLAEKDKWDFKEFI